MNHLINIESSRTDIQFQLQLALFLAEKTEQEQDLFIYSMPGVCVVSERSKFRYTPGLLIPSGGGFSKRSEFMDNGPIFANGRILSVTIQTFGLPHHRYKTKLIQVVFDFLNCSGSNLKVWTSTQLPFRFSLVRFYV